MPHVQRAAAYGAHAVRGEPPRRKVVVAARRSAAFEAQRRYVAEVVSCVAETAEGRAYESVR